MKEELLKVVDEYTEKFCDKKGRIIENNFTKDEEATLKELKRKVDLENLTIYETDKTGKFVVDTTDNYENKMKVHIETDAILTSSQVQNIQNKLNKETKSWLKILEVGTKVG